METITNHEDDQAYFPLVNANHWKKRQRETLKELAAEQRQKAEKERAEEFLLTFIEVSAALCIGGLELAEMVAGNVSSWLAVPLMILSFGWAGARLDRFFRRR